ADARHDLEARKRGACAFEHAGKEGRRGLKVAQASYGRNFLGRLRKETQHSRSDDAESAFGPDEQVLEMVARVVLSWRFQPIPDTPGGEEALNSERKLARIAIG